MVNNQKMVRRSYLRLKTPIQKTSLAGKDNNSTIHSPTL